MLNVQLSDHFELEEAILSNTAIKNNIVNIPNPETLEIMKQAANKLEKVRALLGNKPLHINSWYRSLELNKALGSKITSQHLKGEAIDFVCPSFGTPLAICNKIVKYKELIEFDQLILEHTWIHISFAIISSKPRQQVLSLIAGNHYASGLTDINGNPLD